MKQKFQPKITPHRLAQLLSQIEYVPPELAALIPYMKALPELLEVLNAAQKLYDGSEVDEIFGGFYIDENDMIELESVLVAINEKHGTEVVG